MKQVLIAALTAVFLSACAASGSVQPTSASAPTVDSARSGGVEVSSALADRGDSVDALRRAIIAQLMTKKVFKTLSEPSASDYVLKVNLVDISEVSQGARIFFGALAGQASVTANVEIYDSKEGRVVSSMVAKSSSSGGHVFAGTTQEAIDLAASQIADYLLQNRKL